MAYLADMMSRIARLFVLAVLLIAGIASAHAQFQVNGDAFQVNDSCYQLTFPLNGQTGSVWNINQVSLLEDFEIFVDVFLGTNDGGADGIAFAFQQVSSSVGSTGGGLGISGITPSLFFEFDTYQNGWDPAYDHVALQQAGDVNHTTANNLAGPVPALPFSANLEDGTNHLAYIAWDYISPIEQNIKLYVDCNLLIDYRGDMLTSAFGGNPNVFWGLTASTGALNNLQQFCFRYVSVLDGDLSDTTSCAGDSITLAAPTLGNTYSWTPPTGIDDPSSANPTILPPATTTYRVDAVNVCGQSASDSVVITVLDTQRVTIDTTICAGDAYSAGGSLQTQAGTYRDTLVNVVGCDSIVVTNLGLRDTSRGIVFDTICQGDSLFVADAWQTVSGRYADTLVNARGCDSVRIIDLSVLLPALSTVRDTICQGQSVVVGGGAQTTAGTYLDTLVSHLGCDSIRSTALVVNDTFLTDQTITICQGDSFLAGGAWRFSAGTYVDELVAGTGCDSTVRTSLVVQVPATEFEDTLICQGDSIFVGGDWQVAAGTYIDTLPYAVTGCDSIHRATTVTLEPWDVTEVRDTLCPGDSLFAGGAWRTMPGRYRDTVSIPGQCNDVVETRIALRNAPSPVIDGPMRFCREDSAILRSTKLFVDAAWEPSGTRGHEVIARLPGPWVLTVIDTNGCAGRDTLMLEAIDGCYDLNVPTAFSPNGDGVNDVFRAMQRPARLFDLRIVDRWGEVVFRTDDPTDGWDGTFRGRPAPVGTYVYEAVYSFHDRQEPVRMAGTVTLIR